MLKRVISLLLLACLLMTGLCGCETYDNFISAFFPEQNSVPVPVEETENIKIGVFEPLTGDDAQAASEEIAGIELAHDLFPTVLGKDVELVYGDNESDDSIAADVAQQLVDSGVSMVLGSYRNVLSLAGADVFTASRTPAITITCTNPLITQSNNYYSRACFIDAYQGQSAARYAYGKFKTDWFTIFIMDGDDYGSTLAEQFEEEISLLTGNDYSVATVSFPGSTEDFSFYLEKLSIMRTGPIFFPCDAELGSRVIKQAVEKGYDFNWIGCSKWNGMTENAAAVPDETEAPDLSFLNGVAYVTDYSSDESLSEMTEIFRGAYAAKYGDDVVPGKNVALGFDAYLLALEGISKAGRSEAGTLIANKLTQIKGFAGATGSITMNSKGDPTKDVVINIIQNGEIIAGYTVTQ